MMGPVSTIQVPLLIGEDYRHIMGTAEIAEDDQGRAKLIFSVTAEGTNAIDLVATLAAGEPQGLRFVAIPVTRRNTHSEENI